MFCPLPGVCHLHIGQFLPAYMSRANLTHYSKKECIQRSFCPPPLKRAPLIHCVSAVTFLTAYAKPFFAKAFLYETSFFAS